MEQAPAAAGTKTTGHGTSVFSKDGSIGKQFTAEQGGIGGAAQKVGGPLDKDGAIGELSYFLPSVSRKERHIHSLFFRLGDWLID